MSIINASRRESAGRYVSLSRVLLLDGTVPESQRHVDYCLTRAFIIRVIASTLEVSAGCNVRPPEWQQARQNTT